jgi:hypothetical protein
MSLQVSMKFSLRWRTVERPASFREDLAARGCQPAGIPFSAILIQ